MNFNENEDILQSENVLKDFLINLIWGFYI